ncbi:MAG TPA: malto-oligosyltrehalose trehalohydrolase [Candidatus Limnocylindrales bacterium]|nr:malto-oligosyltrehalose trehalohydrolase [Candidatus Limnocylindrales bacterium]
MTAFRVWAPKARAVELALGADAQDRRPMAVETTVDATAGWWRLDVPEAGPGTRYGFVLDGGGPFPDPRSPRQPDGVHGLSEVVDDETFPWTDQAFRARPLADAVLYELHVGTFSTEGTFEGAIPHLDALVELGVTHVELLPVAAFPGERGWGYDGVALYAPHEPYGGPDGLRRLVDACHARGIAVLLDVVYNHLGPDGNYLWAYGPYFSDRYTTPWGDAVNFDDAGSDEVRRFVIDNARMWIRDYHLDGLRLDAVHEIFDRSAVHVLEELAAAVHELGDELGRPAVVIAESDLNDPRLIRPVDAGGLGLDAQWNDDLRHALHVTLTGETDAYHATYRGIGDLATALTNVFVFDGRYSPFRDRRHGRPVGDLPATRFVGFLQNHDQVGNRALGERSSALMPPGALRAGAAVVLLAPTVPLLFMGEEWAASTPWLFFTDHADPDLAEAVREGRRREFAQFLPEDGEVPDPQDPETMRRSCLDWSERDREEHAAMLDWHRRLIAYRAAHPELRDGSRCAVRFDEEERWLTAERHGIVLAINASAEPRCVPLAPAEAAPRVALASDEGVRLEGRDLLLPAWAAAVVEGG